MLCLALRGFILSFKFLIASPKMPEKQRIRETNIHMSINSLVCVWWFCLPFEGNVLWKLKQVFDDHKEAGGASWGFYRSGSHNNIWELYIFLLCSLSIPSREKNGLRVAELHGHGLLHVHQTGDSFVATLFVLYCSQVHTCPMKYANWWNTTVLVYE